MIKGHGDDAYLYEGITINGDFSSNICPHDSRQPLVDHLASQGCRLLDHYPDPEAWSLERRLADIHGIDPVSVVVTSGATDAIHLVAQTYRYTPVIPAPAFSEYADACVLYPPKGGDTEDKALWLCNPSNPAGQVYDDDYIRRGCNSYELVVVDQSYEYYSDCPVLSARDACQMSNVVLIHSMTKTYGVPGLRLGYITAHPDLAEGFRRFLRPWAVSAHAIEAGHYLLDHHDAMAVRPDFLETRRLWQGLNAINGIEALPTHTNFMLCRLLANDSGQPPLTAQQLKERLVREYGLLIRDASNFQGLTPYHFRVAAQRPQQNDALLQALQAILS